jgi:hypothetical protein
VSPRLFAEIDGTPVPLDSCDWVLWGPCGCPFGLTVGRLSATEEDAWRSLYGRKREIEKAKRSGEHLELMTHERWSREVADRMKVRCPHAEVAS